MNKISMMTILKRYWNDRPLLFVLVLGVIVRLVAAIFSKGYFAIDDHFVVLETSQSWLDGFDQGKWFPENMGDNPKPVGQSYFYPGIHYAILAISEFVGIVDPQIKAFILRLFHGGLSVLTILFGFKITERLSDWKTARYVGLLFAVFFLNPFAGVRSMVEIACIPFLFIGHWYLIKDEQFSKRATFLAGVFLGLAINIRFQSALILGGTGLVLLLNKKLLQAIILGLGAVFIFSVIQGITDYLIWGYPFAQFIGYVDYNIAHRLEYIVLPWYNYILLILGVFIIPFGFFWLFGFFYNWKKTFILFFPTFLFLAFHSYFPNKQERFVFPILPYLMMLGIIGFEKFKSSSSFWQSREGLYNGLKKYFLVFNTFLMCILLFTYSKRSRVEAMYFLFDKPNVEKILIESHNIPLMPKYYAGKWDLEIIERRDLSKENADQILSSLDDDIPFIFLLGEENLEERIELLSQKYKMKEEVVIYPGFVDQIVHWLNPINNNEIVYIYSTK